MIKFEFSCKASLELVIDGAQLENKRPFFLIELDCDIEFITRFNIVFAYTYQQKIIILDTLTKIGCILISY